MRIVSLCPSLTELVFDLGRGDELVGVTEYCVHPKEGVAGIEKVGGTKSPAVERIVALAPDVVLLNAEENRREDGDALAAAGVRCHVSMPRTVEETAEMVRSIGVELERPEEGERIARDIEARAEGVRRRAPERAPVTFCYLIWRKPWMSVNADTFAHALLELAGGRNVFGGRSERYPEVTAEEIARADPRLVLLGTEPFPFRERHLEELARRSGLERERFRIVDGEYLSWHGSRTPDGIEYAARVIVEGAGGDGSGGGSEKAERGGG